MFIFMGFTDNYEVQVFLFLLFPAIYLLTLIGNLKMVLLIIRGSRLHNPMYYFLSVLSFLDACYSSVFMLKNVGQFPERIKPFLILDVQHKCFLLLLLGPRNTSSWLQWHTIVMQQSMILSCIQLPCHPESMCH